MAITVTNPPAPGRWRYAAGLIRLAAWLITHPAAPVPSGRLDVLVPAGQRGARVEALRDIADKYRTTETERGGTLVAERSFGPVRVRAQLIAPDYTRQLAFAGVHRKGSPRIGGAE